ncbi:MAG: type II/IV secretion system protein [Lachnospiraceae bacterium]|nr:type II/IV secretion system protein [Lachnospiraceae bacterium]
MKRNEQEKTEQSAVVLLEKLLLDGYRKSASDIHIEPREECLMVRIRVDGMLVEHMKLESETHPSLIARAKILCGMDIAEKRLPQDGHCKVEVDGVEMDLRASSVPTVYGEKIVLRFLNTRVHVEHEDTFGMDEENYQKVLEILKRPNGIIYITGPTGSGKTTTLYLILERLVKAPVNIMTIEDPVEKQIAGINQIQVMEQTGLTFEKGLRAIMRQDPDIIMVGETRDHETAKISVSAAITGHLVLSTLHTNDAVSAIIRMEDMGIEPYLAANSLSGVVAQRLARKLCPHCSQEIEIGKEEIMLGIQTKTVRTAVGCDHCNGTGYKGRVAIHEVVVIDKHIRGMIAEKRTIEEIYQYVEKTQNIRRLKEDMNRLVEEGITTVEELLRLTYGE